ncbi:MAG: membrane protein insertase YidC [Clostridia bacterium]|nr:membrane protein insertase YidC [Clostridia bacterium]
MDTILYYICIPLGILMKWCWMLVRDYGLAILLFTLATKIVILPLSVWIHKNSILMVKLQPSINFLKAEHYGDMDTIADEQAKLFKKEKYHPMLSLIPLVVQIVLLMGVVQIIYHPLEYLFAIDSATVSAVAEWLGIGAEDSSMQLRIIEAIQSGALTDTAAISGVDGAVLSDMIAKVSDFKLSFLGINLATVPVDAWGIYIAVPAVAGISSWLLCFTQNLSNVIQHEQGKLSKYGLMAVSVGISLYLGFFVPAGIALYWIASNLFSIVQMYILNAVINPKKYVDYDALEKSRAALAEIEKLDETNKKDPDYRKNRAREKADYKRFFGIVNKKLVIYAEKSGFYKYFEGLIRELTKRSNITIHYITNDPNDVIFEVAKTNTQIKPYYIGIKKMIPLMMRLEADMVVMTTPDLDKFYLKRSIMQKDIEYVYVPHDSMSVHMGFREGALDAFDTVFCAGPHIEKEIRATERVYGLPEKTLVRFGYPLADKLIEAGAEEKKTHAESGIKEILIAPSWNEDNILDSCIDELIEGLMCEQYHITVRPHPEYVKRYGARMKAIVDRFADRVGDRLSFELDFSGNKSIYSADLLITDWSGISVEYCFATKRPAIFVNTKMKVLNPNWQKIGCEPVEISLRNIIGVALEKDETANIGEIAAELFERGAEYEETIDRVLGEFLFNIGSAEKAGADYILSSLSAKAQKRKADSKK